MSPSDLLALPVSTVTGGGAVGDGAAVAGLAAISAGPAAARTAAVAARPRQPTGLPSGMEPPENLGMRKLPSVRGKCGRTHDYRACG
jgi:hypothetical protein